MLDLEITNEVTSDADMVKKYLILRDPALNPDGQHMTQEECYKELGLSRSEFYRKLGSWMQSGLLEQMRQALIAIKKEELAILHTEVLGEMPAIIRNLVRIAKTSSGKNAIDAYLVLQKTIVEPALQQVNDPGAQERHYMDNLRDASLKPMDLSDL